MQTERKTVALTSIMAASADMHSDYHTTAHLDELRTKE